MMMSNSPIMRGLALTGASYTRPALSHVFGCTLAADATQPSCHLGSIFFGGKVENKNLGVTSAREKIKKNYCASSLCWRCLDVQT